jgi:hypothetical protein
MVKAPESTGAKTTEVQVETREPTGGTKVTWRQKNSSEFILGEFILRELC